VRAGRVDELVDTSSHVDVDSNVLEAAERLGDGFAASQRIALERGGRYELARADRTKNFGLVRRGATHVKQGRFESLNS
jgi:hypothetical protein